MLRAMPGHGRRRSQLEFEGAALHRLAADGGWCDHQPPRLKSHVSRTKCNRSASRLWETPKCELGFARPDLTTPKRSCGF